MQQAPPTSTLPTARLDAAVDALPVVPACYVHSGHRQLLLLCCHALYRKCVQPGPARIAWRWSCGSGVTVLVSNNAF